MSRQLARPNLSEQEHAGGTRSPARPAGPDGTQASTSLIAALQARAGNRATAAMVRHGGRPSLAERQDHLREVHLVRQLAGLGSGVTEREAHRYLRLLGERRPEEIVAVAAERPAHRGVYEMVQLCLGLPGVRSADIVVLSAAPAVIGVPRLTDLARAALLARTAAELVALVAGLPNLPVAQLTRLARLRGRSVPHLVRLMTRAPEHRIDAAIDLAAALSGVVYPDLLLLLRNPALSVDQLTRLALVPGRPVGNLVRLAERVPLHRSLDDAINLAVALPAAGVRDLVQLLRVVTPTVAQLVRLAQIPGRPARLTIGLMHRVPAHRSLDDAIDLAEAAARADIGDMVQLLATNRPVRHLMRLFAGAPQHRPGSFLARLATTHLLGVDNLLELAVLPPARDLTFLDVLVSGRPRKVSIVDMAALAAALPARTGPDIVTLAHLLPRGFHKVTVIELGRAAGQRTGTALVALAMALPDEAVADLVALAGIRPAAGLTLTDLVRLRRESPASRSTAEIATVADRLAPHRPALSELVSLGQLPGLTGDELVSLVQNRPATSTVGALITFMARLSPYGLTAGQTGHAAELAWAVRGTLPNPHPFLDTIVQGSRDLLTSHARIAGVVNACIAIPPITLAAAMARSPGNLNNLVAHAADLDAAAALLPDQLRAHLLAHDGLIAAGDLVRAILVAAPHLRTTALLTAMTRPRNLARLTTHAADLDAAAALLPDQLRAHLLAHDSLIAAGDLVRAILVAAPHLRTTALLTAMTRPGNLARLTTHAANLDAAAARLIDVTAVEALLGIDALLSRGLEVLEIVTALPGVPAGAVVGAMSLGPQIFTPLHTHRGDVGRALNGQAGITAARLCNVLAYQQQRLAAPPGQAGVLDQAALGARLRLAQSLGGQVRQVEQVMSSALGLPANAAYLNNLIYAVDTLAGVEWDWINGPFTNGAGRLTFRAPVPVRVNGFTLTNHVIAHLLNPQDPAHRIRISDIRRALNEDYTVVIEFNGERRRRYLGNSGLLVVTPHDGETDLIVTVFFQR
ncbi:hypothetical protein V5D56_10410 [Cellulosimicrobium sp. PMB13]|uniref:hypothetical protein n=1 Tax=Cellulosimicrobium sp. PMB13 TaxID=3120158 RepID=UPI003F4B1361